jgi:hypothetical protein
MTTTPGIRRTPPTGQDAATLREEIRAKSARIDAVGDDPEGDEVELEALRDIADAAVELAVRLPLLRVTYPGHMRPGDLYAGRVNQDAPTRPVHNFAAPFRVHHVEQYRDDDDRPMVRVHVLGAAQPNPVSVGTQVLIIRGA